MRIRSKIILLSMPAMLALPLVGCASDIVIPGSAKVVISGQGNIAYGAEGNGNVFVRDLTTKEPIAVVPVQRGDMVFVEPQDNEIEMAGKAIDHKKPLSWGHQYEISFDRAQ